MTKKTFLFVCLLGTLAPDTHAYNYTIPVNGKVVCLFTEPEENISKSIISYCENHYDISNQ